MSEKADIVALAREIASKTLVAGDTFGERHAERLNLQEAIEEAFRSALASAEAAALERAAEVADERARGMFETANYHHRRGNDEATDEWEEWADLAADIAAEIRALIPPGYSPAPAGEAEIYDHPDGGQYIIVERGVLKHPTTGEWVEAVAYRDIKGGPLCMTTAARWRARFTLASSQAEGEGRK